MMEPNAFATDVAFRCNRINCPKSVGLDRLKNLRKHIRRKHRADHDQHVNRKPNGPGLALGVFSTQPAGANAPVSGRTTVYTVYRCRRVGARPLTVTFPHDNNVLMGYVSALERAMMLLGLDHLPALAIRRWPYAHARGHSGSGAILCAVVSLLTNSLCRSDTAVSVNVDGFTDLLFGVGLLAAKAHGAREARLTRLVLATQDREQWEALPAADTHEVTAVFVGTGRQLLAEMFMRLPWEEQ
ncbi:hypothetical protein niasHT_019125 [Heterodera trifolii]|uniref:C2H2-type domain-containing protein n=1 Tax=Heterodera trifolii TaxID=157864 RepID=A0ABD2KYD9_9BILA